MLAEYDNVRPGLKDEIVKNWNEERGHRHWMEKQIVKTDQREILFVFFGEVIGQVLSFLLAGAVLLVAYLIRDPLGSPLTILTGLGALVWNLRRDSKSKK